MCPLFISTDDSLCPTSVISLYVSLLVFYRREVGIFRGTLYLSALGRLPCLLCRMNPSPAVQHLLTSSLHTFVLMPSYTQDIPGPHTHSAPYLLHPILFLFRSFIVVG